MGCAEEWEAAGLARTWLRRRRGVSATVAVAGTQAADTAPVGDVARAADLAPAGDAARAFAALRCEEDLTEGV